jgi:hypothetical protein
VAPWDELQYFDLPVVQQYTNATDSKTPIALADPQRIWISFTQGTASGQTNVSILPSNAAAGWPVSTSGTALIFRARDDPVITQGVWYATIGVGVTLTVVSIRLREWPRSNAVQRVGAPLPWERLVRPQWPSGVGNGQGPSA